VGPFGHREKLRLVLLCGAVVNEVFCRPQSDRIVLDRGTQVVAELPDYNEVDAINLRTGLRTPPGSVLYPEISTVQSRPR